MSDLQFALAVLLGGVVGGVVIVWLNLRLEEARRRQERAFMRAPADPDADQEGKEYEEGEKGEEGGSWPEGNHDGEPKGER